MRKIFSFILLASSAIATFAQSAVSDKLFGQGVDLYNQGKYADAISCFEQCHMLDEGYPFMIEDRKTYSMIWISSCYYRMGDEAMAAEVMSHDYHLDPVDRRLTRLSDSLVYEAQMAAYTENMERAISLMRQGISIESSTLGAKSGFVANSTAYLASYLFGNGDVENALVEIDRSLSIYQNDKKLAKSYAYGCALIQKGSFMMKMDELEEAKHLAAEGLKILEQWNDVFTNDLADAYYILSYCASSITLSPEAKEYALKLKENLFNLPEDAYASFFEHLEFCSKGLCYYGLHSQALELTDKFISVIRQIPDYYQAYLVLLYYRSQINYSWQHYDEALSEINTSIAGLERDKTAEKNYLDEYYMHQANCHSALQQYDEAIKAANEALKRSQKIGEERIYQSILANQVLATCYYCQANEKQSLAKINICLQKTEMAYGVENKLYADVLCQKAYLEQCFQKTNSCLRLLEEAAELYYKLGCYRESLNALLSAFESHAAIEHHRKAITLGLRALEVNEQNTNADKDSISVEVNYYLGHIFKGSGNTVNAKHYYTQAIELADKAGIKDNQTYAKILFAQALLQMSDGNYVDAISLLTQSRDILGRIEGTRSMEYNEMSVYLAQLYLQDNDPDSARRIVNSLNIISSNGESLINANGLIALFTIYNTIGEYDKVISTYLSLKSYIESNSGSTELASILDMSLVVAYAMKEEWDLSANTIEKPTEALLSVLRNNFLTMSAEERMNLWNSASPFFSYTLPTLCMMAPDNTLFTPIAYNGTLINKSMLLQTEASIANSIEKNGSSELKQKYRKLLSDKETVRVLSNNNTFDDALKQGVRKQRIDSLQIDIDNLEHEITERVSTELGDFTAFLDIKWTDIRKRLKNNEIAVEFIKFREEDNVVYGALVIDKNCKCPKILKLVDEQSLWQLVNTDHRKLSEWIWKPILSTMPKCSTVYFSPEGLLYSLPIESLPYWNSDLLLSEGCSFYRLSSTRELVLSKPTRRNNAAVYGGMVYDLSPRDLVADTLKYQGHRLRSGQSLPLMRENRETANTLEELPGTRIEAQAIYQHLNNKIASTKLYEGKDATELSLKALSSTDLGILHIGTHGFYESAQNLLPANMANMYISLKQQEDIVLSHAGLFFSGAQQFLDGIELPEGIEDGVLTALEISTLDFNELDLVTLSACQTGQGDISSEGVFGLQRGFKKSGANSILMSLWNVDDEATQVLMTEFYAQYMQGNSKYVALEAAKRKVRSYAKWQDPKYWAAFILLDAIN